MAGLEVTPRSTIPFLLSVLIPLGIPLLQFGGVYKLWAQHDRHVKRDSCQNSCWDTVFKAGYETGVGSYKHVYFNATWQAAAMWSVTLLSAILLYEAIKYLIHLYTRRRIRWRMAVLFTAAIYPHYYAFWMMWGYFNDDFYVQFSHQLLFTTTELASTVILLQMADTEVQASPHKLMVVVGIGVGHVIAGGGDQFVSNVLKGQGGLHQILRDIGFMVPDILHIILPIMELRQFAKERILKPGNLVSVRMALSTATIALAIWIISLCL